MESIILENGAANLAHQENLITNSPAKFITKKMDSNSTPISEIYDQNPLSCDEFFDLHHANPTPDDFQKQMIGEEIFQHKSEKSTAENTDATVENTEATITEEASEVMVQLLQGTTNDMSQEDAIPEAKVIKITSIEKDISSEFEKNSIVGKQLSSYMKVFGPTAEEVRDIQIGEEFFDKEFSIKLSIWTGKTLFEKSSTVESRMEKIYHNIDKNLLEYYTTKTFLKKSECSSTLQEKLRGINKTVGGKCKLKEKDKKEKWDEQKGQNQDILDYLKQKVYSNSFAEYLFESLIKNKIKKFQIDKLDYFAELLLLELKARPFSQKKHFDRVVKDCLKKANIIISKIAGEAVEVSFLTRLFERREGLLNKSASCLQEDLTELFEEAIIEANIFRVLWMLVNKDMIYELVEKLAKTRLIMKQQAQKLNQKVDIDDDDIDTVEVLNDEDRAEYESKTKKKVKKY